MLHYVGEKAIFMIRKFEYQGKDWMAELMGAGHLTNESVPIESWTIRFSTDGACEYIAGVANRCIATQSHPVRSAWWDM
jgi:hypothetical protein